MRIYYHVLASYAVVCLLAAPLLGQQDTVGGLSVGHLTADTGNMDMANIGTMQQRPWVVAGKVTTLQGDPIPGAKVVVEPDVGAQFRTLKTDALGQFMTQYWMNANLVREFSATVEVVKKGFLKAHVLVDMGLADKPQMYPITLRDAQEDPRLLSRAALTSGLAPQLKNPGPSDGLSSSGAKDYAKGVEEFLERSRPDRALAPFKKALRRDPACLPCRTLLGLAQFEAGDWDAAGRSFGEAINAIRADPRKGRPEPLVAFGVMESWRGELAKAAGFFEEALRFAPQDPLALQELGRSQMLLQNWGPADVYLKKALDAGAGPEARLLRAEALLGGGSPQDASQEFNLYLNGQDVKTMPLGVRQLWARIRDRKKAEVTYAKTRPDIGETIDYLRHPPQELKGLEPAKDQEPLAAILSAVGQNVEEFFHNFPNTSSLEQVRQEKVSRKGKAGTSREQKYRYLCFTPKEIWGPGFSEYRLNEGADQGLPGGALEGFMLTTGFASNSLLFHPTYQQEATFRYLGRQKLNGRETLVVAFAQNPGKARSIGEFKSGDNVVTIFSQGLAWVDAETYQILRLRTDLLAPLPQVRLKKQTTDIDFEEVHFTHIAQGFWLPKEVSVTVDWNGKLLRNVHQYSDFKVFNVESTHKIGKPKEGAQTGP